MKTGSLRVRLFVLAAITIALALSLAWIALTVIFERHVKVRVNSEFANQIMWIAANLSVRDGELLLETTLPDPRFDRPFSGLYWQVQLDGGGLLRSRSLWDETLPEPTGNTSAPVFYEAEGPLGRPILLRAATLMIPSAGSEHRIQTIVAMDRADVEKLVADFSREIAISLALIGLALIAAAVAQVSIGLSPLNALRSEIAAVRARRKSRIDTAVPNEVRPLVEEVNELLSLQDATIARARTQAGDLAHALKTPLTVLTTIARKVANSDAGKEANEILAQVDTMTRRIDRELARARLATHGLATSRLLTLVERLISLLSRTPQGERLNWQIEVDPETVVPANDEDVAEALGNLLENACKWANSVVRVSTELNAQSIVVCIEDDGPGVPDSQLGNITARGTKLDEHKEGSGLGMAIVSDILTAYEAKLDVSRSSLGGLRVTLTWPRVNLGRAAASTVRTQETTDGGRAEKLPAGNPSARHSPANSAT